LSGSVAGESPPVEPGIVLREFKQRNMPVHSWSMNLHDDRIDIAGHLTAGEIPWLVANKALKVLQFHTRVDESTLKLLNDQFFPRRPDVELRAYGFYGAVCDLTFTSMMSNVHHFHADCLMDARSLEHIAKMENLESLGIGIYHLESFDFLDQVTPRLRKLFLGRTASRKPRLSHLQRFSALEELYIEGQQKDIEVVSDLKHLGRLVLRSISRPDLSYVRPLQSLWSLDIKLGGIRDLSAIHAKPGIKYLELWQVRGLSDIHVVSSLVGLQCLLLQSLPQIRELPNLAALHHLRRISLVNMKGLKNLDSLGAAPALEDFNHADARGMEPEDYRALLRNPALKRALVGFGSQRKNKRFEELRLAHGIAGIEAWSEFQFT